MRVHSRTWRQGTPGSSSAVTDASAAVDRRLRTDQVSYRSLQMTPHLTVASQVYYAPLIILADAVQRQYWLISPFSPASWSEGRVGGTDTTNDIRWPLLLSATTLGELTQKRLDGTWVAVRQQDGSAEDQTKCR